MFSNQNGAASFGSLDHVHLRLDLLFEYSGDSNVDHLSIGALEETSVIAYNRIAHSIPRPFQDPGFLFIR